MGWEWRCFFVPRDDAHNALACAGKPEERTDLYLPVSAACGVKARGGSSESTLEVKIRDGVADDGFERWSKEGVKASELARVLELAGHAQPEALRDRRVEVAKRRWQESVGGSAFSGVWAEQTDLRVTVGGAEAQRYRTVAVEGKRGACARPVAQLLSKCRASAVDGTLVICGYPEFVVARCADAVPAGSEAAPPPG